MRSRRLLTAIGTLVLAASALHSAPTRAADCGKLDRVTIAEMTWLSGSINAHIFRRILEEGYGCNVEIVPGDTVPTGTSMLTKGEPMIAPEFWTTSAAEVWDKLQASGNAYKASEIFTDGGNEGWWIPDYTAKAHPDLKTVKDIVKYKDLFTEAAAGGKARLYNCPPGWTCENTNKHLFEALGLGDKGFQLFSPGSGANLKAVIARKVTRKEPILTYYWGPTAVIGRYNLVKLDIPAPYDEETFKCLASSDCPNPKLSAWKSSTVAVVAVPRIKKEAPDVADFLGKVQMPNSTINKVLAWTDQGSAEPAAGADYFLKNFRDVWTNWVPSDAAQRIDAAL